MGQQHAGTGTVVKGEALGKGQVLYPQFVRVLWVLLVGLGVGSGHLPLFSGQVAEHSGYSDALHTGKQGVDVDYTVRDSLGRVLKFRTAPLTIVSLSPGITETIFALGYGNRLVGRSIHCNYPAEALSVPVVSSEFGPGVELIVELNPDIVVSSLDSSPSYLQPLEHAGIRVATLTGKGSLENIQEEVFRKLATILGAPRSADPLVSAMDHALSQTLRPTSGSAPATLTPQKANPTPKPTVYLVIGYGEGGDWTAGGGTWLDSLIDLAGGLNIAQSAQAWSFSRETLLQSDPDIIFLPQDDLEHFGNTFPYSRLTAVRKGSLIPFDKDVLFRQGPRLVQGFSILAQAIASYPKVQKEP